MAEDTDSTNQFLVSVRGEDIVVLLHIPRPMGKAQALNLAAWLVALADDHNQFPALLNAVQNT